MGKKRRPPHSVSAEDIDRDLAEMRHSPITRPNLSFLAPSRQTAQTVKTSPVDISGAAATPRTEPGSLPPPAEIREAPDVLTPAVTHGAATIPVVIAPEVPRSRPLHYCLTARDGHSPTEHLIYSVMWAAGRPEGSAEDAPRLVQMSQPELARRVGITERNLRIAIIRLIEKLAVEEVAGYTKDTKAPRTYRVFSEAEIIQKRREAGLVWVIRRKGVQFVPIGERNAIPTYSSPVVITPVLTSAAIPIGAEPYPVSISSTFRQHGLTITPAIAARLWLECRRRIPDCTAEEIAALLDTALTGLRSRGAGAEILERLLVQWPELTDPAAFSKFREVRRRSSERLREIDEENRRYWESVACDATADESDRRLARRILESL